MIGHLPSVVAALDRNFSLLFFIRSAVNSQMWTILVAFAFSKACACDRRDRGFQEIGRSVERIHILMEDPPHVTAFPAKDPFYAQSFCLGIDLGVETLGEFHGVEETEISALRGIGAQV